MRVRLYRYLGGMGASTSVKIGGLLGALVMLFFQILGILAIIAVIYAIWPQL